MQNCYKKKKNRPLTKSLLGLTALLCSAGWEVIHDGSKLTWPTVCPKFWDFNTRLLEACRQLTKLVDCASTGLSPSELHYIYHTLWWEGSDWLKLDESQWSCQPHALVHPVPQKHVRTESKPPIIPFTQYSNFSHLIHVTTWILQFIHNCKAKKRQIHKQLSFLTIQYSSGKKSSHCICVVQRLHAARVAVLF